MGMRENVAKLDDKKLKSNYRLHMTFAIGFSVFVVLLALATQSIVLPGLLGLVVIVGNGYAAYVTKQEINRRS